MKILAADIGGTNARFSRVDISGLAEIRMSEPEIYPTWSDSIESFDQMLAHYEANRPAGSPALTEFDALAVAIAGAVSGRRATLPNIPWNIELGDSEVAKKTFLLNDFIAQAHGFLDPDVFDRLRVVRPAGGGGPGSIAVVGAGTGLGHAALKPERDERVVIGSEAGHATFAFHGERERAIEASMLALSGKHWLSNDDVVTGSGAVLLHEALTGQAVSPAEALQADAQESATCTFFSRFYARACRNYCLTMFPVEALIISGGVAAKNPHLVESAAFADEFNDGRSYRHLLERIPVYLNQDQALGLKGAAIHAWMELNTR